MKIIKCPNCGKVINVDDSDELDKNEVVGCGLKEGMFVPCSECGYEYGSDGCEHGRENDGLTLTLVSDIEGDQDV